MNSSTGKWITLPGALLALVTLLLPWVEISCGPVRIPLEGYRFAMGTVGEAKDISQAGGFVSFEWVWGFWLAAVLSLVVVGAIVAVRESG